MIEHFLNFKIPREYNEPDVIEYISKLNGFYITEPDAKLNKAILNSKLNSAEFYFGDENFSKFYDFTQNVYELHKPFQNTKPNIYWLYYGLDSSNLFQILSSLKHRDFEVCESSHDNISVIFELLELLMEYNCFLYLNNVKVETQSQLATEYTTEKIIKYSLNGNLTIEKQFNPYHFLYFLSEKLVKFNSTEIKQFFFELSELRTALNVKQF